MAKTMKLSDTQWLFLLDVADLIKYAQANRLKLTGGELYRTQSQMRLNYFGFSVQRKKDELFLMQAKKVSWTLKSQHGKRLAIDFNLFVNGEVKFGMCPEWELLGAYWESLRFCNRWGGNFTGTKDPAHFESK